MLDLRPSIIADLQRGDTRRALDELHDQVMDMIENDRELDMEVIAFYYQLLMVG